MNVLLVDVDSEIPNTALMQISTWEKSQGNTVGFKVNDPDRIYVSCIFSSNGNNMKALKFYYPDAEIILGGSGINYDWLPEHMRKLIPDYSLYDGMICQRCGKKYNYCKCQRRKPVKGNLNYSMGFTTRGCIRNCDFCIVREKEGKLHRWQHVKEFHNPDHKKVILLDNNVYADREWFFENTDYILEKKLAWNPVQGMDIRLLDREIAERLKELKWIGTLHFAFDNMSDEKAVRKGVKILKEVGFDLKHHVQFYVLAGYNTTEEEDKHRCRLLKKLGTCPFVMAYKKTDWTKRLMRWANKKYIFFSCDIDEYEG